MKVISTGALGSGDLSKTLLIYGATQSGKTSLLGTLARAIYQRTGKTTRLILCDEGGPSAVQPEVEEGIIQVVDMVGDPMPQSNLMWLARGCWPGVYWPSKDGVLPKVEGGVPGLDNVGLVALDSISSAALLVLNFLINSGIKISQDVVGLREEQGLKFGNAAPSHYGAVHGFMLQLMTAMSSLPVDKVVYTALEAKAEDNIDKTTVLGPLLVGKAMTGVIPSRMNRILHLEQAASADRKSISFRIYYKQHLDPVLQKFWPANLRLPLGSMQEFNNHPEYGKGFIEFQTGEELLGLLDYCQELVSKQKSGGVEPSKPAQAPAPVPTAVAPKPAATTPTTPPAVVVVKK